MEKNVKKTSVDTTRKNEESQIHDTAGGEMPDPNRLRNKGMEADLDAFNDKSKKTTK